MNLLAVDTTSEGCSAAIWKSGVLFERAIVAPRGHTRHLLPMVREVSAESGVDLMQLDAVAFGRGPGSFTGLRIATGVVQGLAWGLDVPVVPVSSLTAVAAQAIRVAKVGEGDGVVVAFDARMQEVYWQCFVCCQGHPVAVTDAQVGSPTNVKIPVAPDVNVSRWVGAGSGWTLMDQFERAVTAQISATCEELFPLAADIATLAVADWHNGTRVTASHAAPVYVRNTITWKKLPGR